MVPSSRKLFHLYSYDVLAEVDDLHDHFVKEILTPEVLNDFHKENNVPPVRISAYTNQSRVSHSVRMRENSAEEYPKQSSLERSV